MKFFSQLMKNEEGATAIEYGLIAALIAVALVVTLGSIGSDVNEVFGKVDCSLAAADETEAQACADFDIEASNDSGVG